MCSSSLNSDNPSIPAESLCFCLGHMWEVQQDIWFSGMLKCKRRVKYSAFLEIVRGCGALKKKEMSEQNGFYHRLWTKFNWVVSHLTWVFNSDVPSVSIGSMTSIQLHSTTEDKGLVHCRALSSDDDSFCEEEAAHDKPKTQEPVAFSSGYSSVHSASPSSMSSSSPSPLMPCTFNTFSQASAKAQSGFRLLVPMQRPRGLSSKQVKRKNYAAHSGGEVEGEDEEVGGEDPNVGFLSL